MKTDTTHRYENSMVTFEDLKAILERYNLLPVDDHEVADRDIEDIIQLYLELHVFDKSSVIEYTFGGSTLIKDEAGQDQYRLKRPKKVKYVLSMKETQDVKKAIWHLPGTPSGYKLLQVYCAKNNQATLIATRGAKLS